MEEYTNEHQNSFSTDTMAQCRTEEPFKVKVGLYKIPRITAPVPYIDCPHCGRRYFAIFDQDSKGFVKWVSDRPLKFHPE